jgi:hypothetical protein
MNVRIYDISKGVECHKTRHSCHKSGVYDGSTVAHGGPFLGQPTQMPNAPYLLIGFDVDRADPNAAAIIADVENNFPDIGIPLPAGVANTYIIEVGAAVAIGRLRTIVNYLRQRDAAHSGALRWFAQLCRSADLGVG